MAQSNKIDTTMAKYIIDILKTHPNIVMSWGYHNAIAIENGLVFLVQGFLFKGWVKVLYNEGLDLFTVYLINRRGRVVKTIDEVYFDNLVSVIDYNVETKNDKTEKYKEQVNSWLATV